MTNQKDFTVNLSSVKVRGIDLQVPDRLVVSHYAGSKSYGTNIATSDTDIRGVFVADPVHIRTPFFPVGEAKDNTQEDTVHYELSKFVALCCDCNPNVIETLWVDQSDILVEHIGAYAMLREAAPKLLSSKIAFTTSGYAISQLKRIKGHNKWISNPQPEARPQAVDFVSLVHNFLTTKILKFTLRDFSTGHRLVPFGSGIFGLYKSDGRARTFESESGALIDEYDGQTHELPAPLMLLKFNKQQYEDAVSTWTNYWTWKKNRNVVRSALEVEHGYDTKHAMHLVRLLRMGAEALTTGIVNVRRPDAAELLEIRNGAWTYEQLIKYADEMDEHIRNELYQKTQLPKQANTKLAAKLIMDIQDMMWAN